MKKLLLATIIAVASAGAYAGDVNQATKNCLKQLNYSQKNFDTFNFVAAAACQQKTIAANIDKKDAEYLALLKDKPYYGGDGSGWYKSVETYGTGNMR